MTGCGLSLELPEFPVHSSGMVFHSILHLSVVSFHVTLTRLGAPAGKKLEPSSSLFIMEPSMPVQSRAYWRQSDPPEVVDGWLEYKCLLVSVNGWTGGGYWGIGVGRRFKDLEILLIQKAVVCLWTNHFAGMQSFIYEWKDFFKDLLNLNTL